MLLRALLATGLIAVQVSAASYDCAKAVTIVEKTICATPRLSALDEELATTYKAVAKSAEARQEQRAWLVTRNACEDNAECIEASYLARIASLRLANRTFFARQKPPARIFGHYFEMTELCFVNAEAEEGHVCEGEVENYVDVGRGPGNALTVKGQLYFYNGHTCSIEDSPAEWVGGELRVSLPDSGLDPCVLVLRFEDGGVTLVDPDGRCRSNWCGARGGFDGIALQRK